MASHHPQSGSARPRMSAFEEELGRISQVYSGQDEKVRELITSFVNAGRKFAAEVGCFDPVEEQPNAVCVEHSQAALKCIQSVHAILETLNSNQITHTRVEKYLVRTVEFCLILPRSLWLFPCRLISLNTLES
jgi:hypothetical protein